MFLYCVFFSFSLPVPALSGPSSVSQVNSLFLQVVLSPVGHSQQQKADEVIVFDPITLACLQNEHHMENAKFFSQLQVQPVLLVASYSYLCSFAAKDGETLPSVPLVVITCLQDTFPTVSGHHSWVLFAYTNLQTLFFLSFILCA